MKRKNIIIYIIISVTLIIILSIFIIFKNKKIYISNINELDDIKISMLKLEDGVTTVIKQVPTIDSWTMTYECDDETVKIYWDEGNRKLYMKNIKPTACIIKFEKSLSAVNVSSIYVDDVYVGELDINKMYNLVSYDCSNNETVTWNILNRTVSITPLNTNTHCKLYFKEVIYLYNKILLENIPLSDSSIIFTQPSSITNGRGLYYTEDNVTYGEDNTRIYYFRGRVDNNWVSFKGFLWRIIRTTSEGGVKLAYSGDGSSTSSAFINTSAFNTNNNSKYYVGYTYNTSGYTGTQTGSTTKILVDNWYINNIASYFNYLSDTAVYCNDRSSERVDGIYTYYPAYDRIVTNKRPTYACLSTNASRYTVSTSKGNGYLSYRIALLNADEIYYSGLVYSGSDSLDSYIMDNATSNSWWTMSPYYFNNSNALEFYVSTLGSLNNSNTNSSIGMRPVVSLKSCIIVTEGNGSKSTPYIISNIACT